jgi:methylated-DNA-[protein]-cysteine S-methyltransferase
MKMKVFRYPTPKGFDDLLIYTDGEVLTGLLFAGSHDEMNVVETRRATSLPTIISDTCRWLDVYFSGRQPDFTPAYRMEGLTPFRKAVLDVVCEIPFGQTITYGEIAKQLKINSAQAVGGAVGWNPICLIVPCHRVMGAKCKLTGYGGGLPNKIALLKLEGNLIV